MANRLYLYSANSTLTKLRDISECAFPFAPHPFPLSYMILLGVDTQVSTSRIWGYEHPIAIKANFKEGLQRLYDFFEYLKSQKGIDQTLLLQYEHETKTFWEKHPDRTGELFFLEAGEIYDMTADVDKLEVQNEEALRDVQRVSRDIKEILETKPENLFEVKTSYWFEELQKDTSVLEVYWTHVTYFSFNES